MHREKEDHQMKQSSREPALHSEDVGMERKRKLVHN